MAYSFDKKIGDSLSFFAQIAGHHLSDDDRARLKRINRAWNFYEGFHWEEIGETDSPQVTVNYCKRFIDKLVAFEFGKGFVIKMKPKVEGSSQEDDPLTFLNSVWDYNKKFEKCFELGQSKAVTGDGYVGVFFEPKMIDGKQNPNFEDPFNEFDKGRFKIIVNPSSICYPQYKENDKETLESFTIMYLIEKETGSIIPWMNGKKQTVLYRQVWTKDTIKEYIGKGDVPANRTDENKYGIIPFVQIKNNPVNGKVNGTSDIDDMIPINTEINLKKSNISEIIDYHAAPVTVVFGARIANLERGANKVWGGLPKDAKVENLSLEGELDAAQKYVDDLKQELREVCGIPVGALGGEMNISNTSAVALQISLMPLLEIIERKQKLDADGLVFINKLILKIALIEGLIQKPAGMTDKDFYFNEVMFESMLPKDQMELLQEIDAERKMMLLTREDALKRLGRDNISNRIKAIDKEYAENPDFYVINNKNKDGQEKQINAGLTNGPTPKAKSD